MKHRNTTKSEATRALRLAFGPLARISNIDRAGVRGVRVVVGERVLFQTFDLTGDVFRAAVVATLPTMEMGL